MADILGLASVLFKYKDGVLFASGYGGALP